MDSTPTASVIVVNRGRPEALMLCLRGIDQLFYHPFEVIVVADPAGISAIEKSEFGASIKLVAFDQPNISVARNLGLEQAAGEIVAFIDDDSVPEPTWLDYLIAPFGDPLVMAAGGYVRGRNGISFQSKAQYVDETGAQSPIQLPSDAAVVLTGKPGAAIKTEGTNCAFRRSVLLNMGGFDPAFPFYLDETDLNVRLAHDSRNTAIVPLAQVHHGFAASDRRAASRVPHSLFDVGASSAVLLRKHAGSIGTEPVFQSIRDGRRASMIRHMVAGNCEPGDVTRVMQTLERGFAAGLARTIGPLPPIAASETEFRPWHSDRPDNHSRYIAGRSWSRRRLRQRARHLAENGKRISLFLFSPTALFHRVTFTSDGYWEQRGGLFGKSVRGGRLVQITSFGARVQSEVERLRLLRRYIE